MAKFRIEHHRDVCIGCGACAAVCPENWSMDEDDIKSKPKKTELDELGCNQDAADNCPVKCIIIKKL